MIVDDKELPDLTRRQEEILSLIVEAYTDNPEPISSKYLVESFALGVSSATIRNEMAVLEDKGYIGAPHTSAGRIPTEQGYRYFVRRLLKTNELSPVMQSQITEKMHDSPLATEQWMRLAASVMARAVQSAALVTPPISETNRFKHLELIAIQGRLVLMVLVLHSGNVHQQMLNLAEPLPQQKLSEVAEYMNELFMGLTAKDIRMKSLQFTLFEREVTELAADVMDKADSNQVRFIYRDGLSSIINAFHGTEGATQAVRVFEERAVLNVILSEILSQQANDVQVFIAGDGRWEELNHLTMVLSRYGIPGYASGALGVVGPTHLDYGRAISTVSYMSRLMTNMLVRAFDGEPPYDSLPSGE